MRFKRTLIGITAIAAATAAVAQSNGERFDAAIVLTPGMALQRGGITFAGTWDSGLLRHGDVVMTDNITAGTHYIVTTDGTVIGMSPGTTIAIDGRQIGFDVFQVYRGSANILGNVNDGFPLPSELSASLPLRFGNITIQQPAYNPYYPPNYGPSLPPVSTFPRQVYFPSWSSSSIVLF